MKLILTIFLATGCIAGAYSQDNTEKKEKRKRRYRTYSDFRIDLGINDYLEDGKSPVEDNELYEVRPWGSWYIALKAINETHITGPLYLDWGADVSWYNFKFQDESVRVTKEPGGVVFSQFPEDIDFRKSKLTAAFVNVSAVPTLKFGTNNRRHKRWRHWECSGNGSDFSIGAGMYAGYRIMSYAKYVTEMDGDKERDRDKDSFFLNNIRYGVRGQMGFRDLVLFFNYDLNELFADNKGPKLNAFSFGVVI